MLLKEKEKVQTIAGVKSGSPTIEGEGKGSLSPKEGKGKKRHRRPSADHGGNQKNKT